jgi:hypothetical protein
VFVLCFLYIIITGIRKEMVLKWLWSGGGTQPSDPGLKDFHPTSSTFTKGVDIHSFEPF